MVPELFKVYCCVYKYVVNMQIILIQLVRYSNRNKKNILIKYPIETDKNRLRSALFSAHIDTILCHI